MEPHATACMCKTCHRIRVEAKLDEIRGMLVAITRKEDKEMALIDDVLQGVKDEKDLEQSMITLLGNLKTALDAAGTDQAKLQAVKDQIDSNKALMAATVVAGTPADPAAPAPTP